MSTTPTPPQGPGEPDLAALLQQFMQQGAADPAVADALRSLGVDPSDPAVMSAMTSQLRTFLDPRTRPSTQETARVAARAATAGLGADPVVPDVARRAAEQAVSVAQLWLDPVTTIGAPTHSVRALSRADWVEATMTQWSALVAPVADGLGAAITGAMTGQLEQLSRLGPEDVEQLELPPELAHLPGAEQLGELFRNPAALADLVGRMEPFMAQMSGAFVAAQTGQAVGTLAADVLTGTEVGLPLLADGVVALLPAAVDAFAADLGLDSAQVRLYLAVRESARVRLFHATPWLGPAVLAAVEDYARRITIDTAGIEEAVASIDMSSLGSGDVDALREAVQGRLFEPAPTREQQAALGRLETLLALIEGWVDHVTARAVAPHLPSTEALAEAVRRRRVGGPAHKAFQALVGLDLRPRRLRDAANLWAAIEADGGAAHRDSRWQHPDVAPTSTDLDDPLGYVERSRTGTTPDDVDAELAALLDGDPGRGPADGVR